MVIAVILLVAGLVAGLARGGRIENLGRAQLRYPGLVFAGLGVQVGGEIAASYLDPPLGQGAGLAILAASYGLLVAFVITNRTLPGALFIAAGMALNLLVIGLNGAMPVSPDAARAAGLDPAGAPASMIKHEIMRPDTLLKFLGDVIPLPLIGRIVSAGDVLLGIGVFLFVERLVRYKPRRLMRTQER